ncbi:hypothetical protein CROQUDRAFT_89201 [Cronartium quercuum f. sp. fusiforme G11]|uniref:Uncharacterized protein n=1 Tax=Cronartium quercuum f. sp. fusiforme G11 TaxID=708437 RepID=A0A9P6NNQ4_9BASI|nr:hypothetical protein CROQUDRAFT_89201 [Cronartium quercuum f. sp. fusiforme G11]
MLSESILHLGLPLLLLIFAPLPSLTLVPVSKGVKWAKELESGEIHPETSVTPLLPGDFSTSSTHIPVEPKVETFPAKVETKVEKFSQRPLEHQTFQGNVERARTVKSKSIFKDFLPLGIKESFDKEPPEFHINLRLAIGGTEVQETWALNQLVKHMKEIAPTDPEKSMRMANFFEALVNFTIRKEIDIARLTRLQVALSTVVRSDMQTSENVANGWKSKVSATVERLREFSNHPSAMVKAWDSKLPQTQFVVRVIQAEEGITSYAATLDSILEVSLWEAPRAHYIITSGGRFMTQDELMAAKDQDIGEIIRKIERTLMDVTKPGGSITTSDELALMKTLYALEKFVLRVDNLDLKLSIIAETMGGIFETLSPVSHLFSNEGQQMLTAIEGLERIKYSSPVFKPISSTELDLKVWLRLATPEKLKILHYDDPSYRKFIQEVIEEPDIKQTIKRIETIGSKIGPDFHSQNDAI